MNDTKERRPGEGAAPKSTTTTTTTSLDEATDQSAVRRRWAYRLLRRCPVPPPLCGSRQWAELDEGDPAKVAGVVVAAEAWAQGGDELVDDLRRELDERRRAEKHAEDAEYVARAEAHRAEWSKRTTATKSFAERRAEQLESVKPRPGDFQGQLCTAVHSSSSGGESA